MIGLILATGSTDSRSHDRLASPRGLMPIGNQPLVFHIADRLTESGCREIMVVTHASHQDLYRAQFADLYKPIPVRVETLPEADTVHSFIEAVRMVDACPIMAVADDEIFDFSLRSLIAERERTGRPVVAVIAPERIEGDLQKLNFGMCATDSRGHVTGVSSSFYHERDITGGYILTGIYYYDSIDTAKLLHLDTSRSSPELIHDMHIELQALPIEHGYWADLGKPEMLAIARRKYEA
ncbi:MAG: NTP transferase domain-containing protein [Leptospiraceae bacterium]|nr:NTP transferase domain-containing protein [Leptospiraceae bacterium]